MDVTYRFIATGHDDVEKAFTGIEARAKASKKATDDATKAQARGAATTRKAQSDQDRKFKEAERAAAKYEREAQREAKAAERAAAAKQRASEKSAKQTEAAAARAAKREADAKVREAARAQKHVDRIRDRHFADEQRRHEREQRDLARKEAAARSRAERERASKRKQSFGVLKDLAGGAFLGTVASGAALIGAAAKESIDLQEAAARIAISARGPGEQARDATQLRRSFEQTAIRSPGVKASEVADAVARFVSLTGDLDTALSSQDVFATTAVATGSNIGDIAETAASLSQQFDITGLEDMRGALAALTFQGKAGSFELKDAAAQFQKLAAAGAAFGLDRGVKGAKTLGGLTQIARSGTGSAEEAATAVMAMFAQLTGKQKELKTAGVDVFDKSGKARNVGDILIESISKVGGADMAKKKAGLFKIFDREGMKAVNPLLTKYSAAFQGAEGSDADKTAAGIAALRAEIERSINAPGEWADVVEDAALAQKSASAQLSTAWESIKAKTADALLPAFAKLAEKLGGKESMLDPFIEAVGLAAEALVGLHDFLEGAGLIKRKEKSKAEIAAEAQKAADDYKRKGGARLLAAGGDSKLLELNAQAKAAKDAVFEKGGAPTLLSKDAFVEQYMKAGGIDPTERGSVEMLAGALQKDPADSFRSNDFAMRMFGGENQAQQDVRRQFQASVTAQKMLGQDQAEQQLNTLAQSAARAAEAMAKVDAAKQGSIVTGQ